MSVIICTAIASVSPMLWDAIVTNVVPITGASNRAKDVVIATVKSEPSVQTVTTRQDSASVDLESQVRHAILVNRDIGNTVSLAAPVSYP